VTGIGVEVVSGAVEVDGQQKYGVEAVFGAIGLGLDEEHFLCQAIGCVGLLGVTVPEVVFPEGNGREFRIGADGADCDELLDISQAGLLDKLDTHNEVFVEEFAGVLAVGADSADDCCEVDDNVGGHIVIHSDDVIEVDEVVVLDFGDEDIFAAAFLESLDYVAAEEAGAAGDDNASIFKEVAHCRFFPCSTNTFSSSASFISASVIILANSLKVTFGFQLRTFSAFVASPWRKSTSAGLRYLGSISTNLCQSRPR